MTTNNAPGLYLDSGEFVPAAELNTKPAAAAPTSTTGAQWVNIEAAAMALAEAMDYPWEEMPAQGREAMRKHAQAVIDAANGKKKGGA